MDTEKTAKRGGKKLILKILGGIVIFVVALLVVVNLTSRGAVVVGNRFINLIQTQKAAEAYALFSKEAAVTITPADFKMVVERVGPILSGKPKVTGKQIGSETGGGTSATISYEMAGTDNLTYRITINLAKQDGEWKIMNFDSKVK